MADNKLVKVQIGDETALTRRLDPTVISKADPPADWLLQARADLRREGHLQDILLQGKEKDISNEDLADHLGTKLNEGWQGDFASEAYEAALYLLDEYDQLGEGIHLVSKVTGRVVVTLTDSDIWDPGMVPREGGGMAPALKRIRPDLESALTVYAFDRERETRVVEALAERGLQTDLLKEEGDPRLLVATRHGRTQIVKDLAARSPEDLLLRCGGTARMFLQHFDIVTEEPKNFDPHLEGTLIASSSMNVHDQSTINLHHNRAGILQSALAHGWVRDLAQQVAQRAFERTAGKTLPTNIKDLKLKKGFWIVPPEAISVLGGRNLTLMPVDGAPFTGFLDTKVGTLVIPEQFGAETNELFEKWTTSAHLEFKLQVDWSIVDCMNVTGLEYQAIMVPK